MQNASSITKGIGSVAIDTNRGLITDSLANGADALNVFPVIWLANFYFVRKETRLLELKRALADRFWAKIHSKPAHKFYFAAIGPAKKIAYRQPMQFTQGVKYGGLDGRFCNRVTNAKSLQFADQATCLLDVHTDKRRRKIFSRHDFHRLERFISITRSALCSLAPTLDTVFQFQTDNQRTAVLEKPRCAAVNLPHRQNQGVSVKGNDLRHCVFSNFPMRETSSICSNWSTVLTKRPNCPSGKISRVNFCAFSSTSSGVIGLRGVPLKWTTSVDS